MAVCGTFVTKMRQPEEDQQTPPRSRVPRPSPGHLIPALVLVGEDDKPFRRAGEVMAAKLPQARHVVVPDAGHIVNIEQAEVFNREVLQFLSESFPQSRT